MLTELLKRFQSTRGELSAALHRAESAIGEQASYMGKANVCRLRTKVYLPIAVHLSLNKH